ncbi:hypothetical protein [Isoptericola sp. NPDC058082]|uniref:hypothetical protein n=1 Tax=Isoptericola sp. NPDC058082 TaxID=3346331 RepID=UPI0036E3B4F4
MSADVDTTAMTEAEARASVDEAKQSITRFAECIVEQVERRAWLALGHGSWAEMREAEYGGEASFLVPTAKRRELVARLRAAGLTQREIAATAGVAERTVRYDLNGTGKIAGPAVADEPCGRCVLCTGERPKRADRRSTREEALATQDAIHRNLTSGEIALWYLAALCSDVADLDHDLDDIGLSEHDVTMYAATWLAHRARPRPGERVDIADLPRWPYETMVLGDEGDDPPVVVLAFTSLQWRYRREPTDERMRDLPGFACAVAAHERDDEDAS